MANKEIEEVPKEEVEVEDEGHDVVEATPKGQRKKIVVNSEKKSRVRKPNKHVEDWLKILPGSSNAILTNDHIFRDPYFLVCDVECPRVTSYDLFKYFYQNRT